MPELATVKTDEFTIANGHLPVGDGHEIYYEFWGNPDAESVILSFHGGPGGQFKDKHKYIFDPKTQAVILFDQRGCGNSMPYGKREHNTTDDTIADAVKLLEHLKINSVHIYGGSWGSALALLFAIREPKRVKNVIVNGVFTGSQAEIDFLDKGLFVRHYPEVWERFQASVPVVHRNDPAAYHYEMLNNDNPDVRKKSAKALEELEMPLLGFDWPGYDDIKRDAISTDSYDEVPYMIYAHYLSNECFLPDAYILKNAHTITAPLYIVQGRYDMACPPITAYTVHKAVPGSKLFMTLGSHGRDPENRTALKTLISTVF